jgi:hypothetical protein
MDGLSRVFAHYLPTMIFQPVFDGTVKIKPIYQVLDGSRKYVKVDKDMRVLPAESEQDLLNRWFDFARANEIQCTSNWPRYLKGRPKKPTAYEWFTRDMHPLQKPWFDQEIAVFRDPNQSSTTPIAAPAPPSSDGFSGSRPGLSSGSGAGPSAGPSASTGPDQAADLDEGHHAPPYPTSARRPYGKVDVVITVGAMTFGHSVDSRVTVEMLQRIARNVAQSAIEGYWIPIVTRGEGTIGCLCPHDEILIYPGTQEDIDRINEPCT